ncbi:DNA methyltransferase [Kribbella sp. VKM Ac-2568]|uniref:DNA methyltransferase n=1 Tax=Kribbella sp. VKM Ac-2568 TaxID=2512219 RepID=UPI001047F11F|nr:DNA methyltransferase [Kribbella sp. VKM Ac-2568]TCM35141.1 DNA methylase [Kribbella sp. VKM Ac-2568]
MSRHRFHSMCPYFAMFPEAFARAWIERLTKPGEVVFDPFAGRGTAPFEALLLGRVGIGGDINPVAACLNRAKLAAPQASSVLRRLNRLEDDYQHRRWMRAASTTSEFFQAAYHRRTLAQLLYLRESLDWRARRTDAMVSALILGGLHGEVSSMRYLSNQMPRTISTKPDYSVRFWTERSLEAPERDAFDMLRQALSFRYASPVPDAAGETIFGDIRDVPRKWRREAPKLIITSPPYRAVTSYEEDQWLRLWFLGGPDRPNKSRITRDDRHIKADDYWNFIGDFWRVSSAILAPRGHVVMRVGATGISPKHLEQQLRASVLLSPRKATIRSVEHSEIGRRQTDAFRPGSRGCVWEIDMHVTLA